MEDAIQFGVHNHLSGVYCHSAGGTPEKDRVPSDTAVIIVTAGMLQHSGPFRLHVDLARSLSHVEIPSLRFDLSGIGESLGIGASGRSMDRATSEIRAAIDWLSEHRGIRQVLLFGLCSGADDAIAAAVVDPRIVGVLAMDGCGYRTPFFHVHRLVNHYFKRLFNIHKWRSLLKKHLSRPPSQPSSLRPGSDSREFPSREQSAVELKQLAEQGTWLHFLYTGGVADYYNHAGQFRAMFPELSRSANVTSVYWPWMDHVAFLCEDRQRLVEHVVEQFQLASAGRRFIDRAGAEPATADYQAF